MNIAEAQLLNSSLGDLTNVLLRKRAAEQQALEHGQELDLRREELGLRRDDQSDARATRKAALEAQAAHQQRLEELQKEGNADKRAEMGLKFLSDLNKSGQLTDDGLARMEQVFNEKLGGSGVGVKLFRAAPSTATEPQPWKHPRTGKEFVTFGKTLLNAEEPYATVTEEQDPMTGALSKKIQRRVRTSDLDAEAAQTPARPPDRTGDVIKDARLDEIDNEIAAHAKALAQGDESSGLRSMVPFALKNRRGAIEALQAERAKLLGRTGPATPSLSSPVKPVLKTIRTQEEFDALASGQQYINAKDGRTYTKP